MQPIIQKALSWLLTMIQFHHAIIEWIEAWQIHIKIKLQREQCYLQVYENLFVPTKRDKPC